MNAASIRTHLLLLVLAISVPLMAAVGFGIYADLQQSIAHSKTALRTLASTMVRNTGGRIDSSRQMLERLAARPLVRLVDAAQCDPVLKDLHTLDPAYANSVYTNLDGLAICSAVARPDGKPVDAKKMHWYQEFRKVDRFSVGQPHYGPISKKWVSVLSAPIRNERQEMVGAVHLSLDLKNYDPHIPDQFLPEGSRYGFMSDDGILIWRNIDPEEMIGRQAKAEAARRTIEVRDGEFESTGSDGVTRFFSVVPMPDTGWVAFVGVPADTVFAAARQRAVLATLIALAAIGALMLLAVAIARRIGGPIAALKKITHAVHDGDSDIRAMLSGPSEVIAVAQEFNAMLDTQQRNEVQLRKLAQAVEQSPVGIVITNLAAEIEFVNEAFVQTAGRSRNELIGRNLRIWKSGKTPRATYHALWEALSGGRTWQGELINRRKDGSEYVVFSSITPLRQPDGRITHYVGAAQDVTEKKLLGIELHQHRHHLEVLVSSRTAELAASRDAAETANRAKSIFLANMSHELRTPLNAILGFSRLLERNPGVGHEGQRQLATINRSGQHLLALINDVLEISRIEAGRAETRLVAFGLGELVADLEEMIRVRAASKGLALAVECSVELPRYVLGDAHHLKQVLINLLGNAVKYTEHGSVSLRVSPENGSVRFAVSDTGPGISAADQERIFQAFYQTEVGVAKGEGTGLGLTISHKYARLMGGKLSVSSQPGRGSVFVLAVPLPATGASAAGQNHHKGSVVGLMAEAGCPRVLVVDDNADNRELVEQLLAVVGFDVRSADDGQQAVDAFVIWQPQFIWMDMQMPVMDGYEATRRIRALHGGREVKIVALTASAFQEDRAAVLAAGCDDMVIKPLEEMRLFEVMERLLGLRYQYDAEDAAAIAPPAVDIDLSALPEALVAELRCAAEKLDMEAARSIATSVALEHKDVARHLEALVNDFRFDLITALCEKR
jgi:PAS domain S-box-containing protein